MEPFNYLKPFARMRIGALGLVCAFLFAAASPASAQESAPVLDPVVVVGTVPVDVTGKSTLSHEQLSLLPAGDGNVEDLARLMPGVQISDESNTSFQAGEIKPPLLSISGGRPYDNNFRIDGVGNNSLIDPAYSNPHNFDRLPGHPEEIFLNTRLIDQVTVYDHNIPVRFGGFTGGVVDVRTIEPADDFTGAINYRTTRDSWTEFHVDPADQDAFVNSKTYFRQPEFTKHGGGVDLSFPLNATTGLLFSYQFNYSEIPLVFLDRKHDQHRMNENYLVKLVHEPNDITRVTLEAIYNPYEGDYFTTDTMNGDFTLKGGGLSLVGRYETTTPLGAFELTAGIRSSENSRTAPKDYFNWGISDSKDWGALIGSSSSKEGGFGDIDIAQDSYEVNVDWLSPELRAGEMNHRLNAGLQWHQAHGSYDRDVTSYSYRTPVPSVPPDLTLTCGLDSTACIPGEQYLSTRSVYGESHNDADLNQYAVYVEDLIAFRRLDLRPGVRVSYDDLMKNWDVAPRLSGSYALFDNRETRVIGGWSRYYGETLLTYKLREGIAFQETQTRASVIDNDTEWTTTNIFLTNDQFSRLKTPYADEVVAGIDQDVWGGLASFRYVTRDGEDEFARERDPFVSNVVRYARLNNNGKSHYESYQVSWERQWLKHYLGINATYSKSTATHGDYEDTLLTDDLNDQIWYAGELLYPDELPRNDYNRPWVANLVYSVAMPGGFLFSNVMHFRDGYRNIENSGTDIDINGTLYDVYREYSRPSSTLFDWRLDWQPPQLPDGALTITLEVFNVFDKRAHVGAEVDEYELGRQFWLGAEYRF